MATFIQAANLSEAWVEAYGALERAPRHELVNLVVDIADPIAEMSAIQAAIDYYLATRRIEKGEKRQSCHTVANTIFPVSIYRPDQPDASSNFFMRAQGIEKHRADGARHGWGTYFGRMVAFPSPSGRAFNQLEFVLNRLRIPKEWHDVTELPIVAPEIDAVSLGLHEDGSIDRELRGGPCLAHVSLTRAEGALSLAALYRRHEYETRAYGNFVGLARLLAFLARESGLAVGQLTIVASHAKAIGPGVRDLAKTTRAALEGARVSPLEVAARPLGVGYADLELPRS